MSGEEQPVELHITSVQYERRQGVGHYSHETIGATAYINEWEDPEKALELLRAWVDTQLGLRQRAEEIIQSCETLKEEEKTLQEAVSMMRNRYERARVFLEKIGVPVPTSWPGESGIPF